MDGTQGDRRGAPALSRHRRHRHHRLRHGARRRRDDQEGASDFITSPSLRRADARHPDVDRTGTASLRERVPAIAARGGISSEGIIGAAGRCSRSSRCSRPWRARRAPSSSPADRHRKEVIAKIHHNSPRKTQRFVAINCAALPRRCSKASSSVTRGIVHRRDRHEAGTVRACAQRTIFSRRDRTMSLGCRANCCGRCRSAPSSVWVATRRSRWTCGSLPPPTRR